jgi:acetyl-CoA C-acetyltransferase
MPTGGAIDPRTPCLIGVAQRTWHLQGDELAPEPLDMWTEVARAAAADAEATGDVLGSVGSLQVVYCMSWPYDDPAARLAAALGTSPAHTLYSGIGGTTPQVLLNAMAERMLRGELDVGLVVGAEALDTVRRLKKAGERAQWSHRNPEKVPFPFEAPFHPAEVAHEVFQAWLTFAVRDVARRARVGVAPDAYRERIGDLLEPMTHVAAENPYAWFPEVQSAERLITPTSDNRMIGYPYTKRSVSIMDVDMASAAILATHEAADHLGVPADRRVYMRGWAYATDAVYVAEHPDLGRSPAMSEVFAEAMRCADLGVDDIAHLDLYSCFASSVFFALDALGMTRDDPRSLTQTGGLPFAGGAASNYMGHSIAAMTEALRRDPSSAGMVTGVGMHMTKHVAGVYSTDPGSPTMPSAPAPEAATVAIRDSYDGPATVAAYSVVHGRSGDPEWALLVCDVTPTERCYARVDGDADLLRDLEAAEWVGRVVTVRADGAVNRASRR